MNSEGVMEEWAEGNVEQGEIKFSLDVKNMYTD